MPGELTAEDDKGRFPLHCAIAKGHFAVAAYLLSALQCRGWAALAVSKSDLSGATCVHLALLCSTSSGGRDERLPDLLLGLVLPHAEEGQCNRRSN